MLSSASRPFTIVFSFVSVLALPSLVQADNFKPGDVIEYRVRGEYPEKWERGVFLREVDGGSTKQYLIRQKPNQFFKDGFESTVNIDAVRRPMPVAKAADAPAANPPAPAPKADPKGSSAPGAARDGADAANGLLSKEDVLAYARKVFGGGNKQANQSNPKRDALVAEIRDYIKKRGTNFKVSAIDDFANALNEQGTSATHIYWAINDNYGPPPKLEDYFGTWLLRAANRGSSSVKKEGAELKKITVDEQHDSGRLTINKDGTYEWELLKGDPPEKWLRGKWREAKPDEMNPTEGGPAIWLEKAKQGYEYMVRMDREIGWTDWINVGAGKGRTPVEFGRPAAKK